MAGPGEFSGSRNALWLETSSGERALWVDSAGEMTGLVQKPSRKTSWLGSRPGCIPSRNWISEGGDLLCGLAAWAHVWTYWNL